MNGTSAMTAVRDLTTDAVRGASRCDEPQRRGRGPPRPVAAGSTPRIHAAKPHPGRSKRPPHQAGISGTVSWTRLFRWRPVQDRYSLRCSPQAARAARDAVVWANELLAIELNSGNDNPLCRRGAWRGAVWGNFFGGHPALAMDLVRLRRLGGDLVDRQFALLVDRHTSMGLQILLSRTKAVV